MSLSDQTRRAVTSNLARYAADRAVETRLTAHMSAAPRNTARSDNNFLGIFYLCAGLFIFSFQDIIIKELSDSYPVSELVFVRSMVAMPLLLALVHLDSGFQSLRSDNGWLHLVRALLMFLSYFFYYLAIASVSIPTVVSLFFTAPLFITALAVPFLGEPVGIRRWLGVIVGFGGVVIMLRPGSEGFEPAALLALASALTYSCSQILARRLGAKDSASMMAFYSTVVYAYAGGLIAIAVHMIGPVESSDPTMAFLTRPWSMPNGIELAMLATTGVISAMGFFLLSQAYRIGQANVVAPFEYSALVWAVGLTYIVYGSTPDVFTYLGAAIILGAGVYVLKREQIKSDRPLAAKGPYRSR